jgi:hypothetical protein
MNHSRVNAMIAAAVFVAAFLTYLSTVAITTSFWDCGEFITCSYILGVPHPPGAPLYVLLGRLFTMLPKPDDIGLRVNLMSPIMSGLTAMLTYLIIVRLIMVWKGQPKNWSSSDRIAVYASGIIGALAFAFSDSQWFNSVEAEVYAGSMFFTAIVVWLILKWMDHADSPHADRYILIIFYLMGLAIGVHLLNLLALPTIAMIIFARLYKAQGKDAFREFILMSMCAGAGAFTVGFINSGIVKGIPNLMQDFGMQALGFGLLILLGLVVWAIREKKRIVSLGLFAILVVVLGYSTYTTLFIRSKLDPAVDENNPDTAERLVKYLNREQYGDWSLFPRRAPLWEYQVKKMFIRYFGWQFIGKGTTLDREGRIVETITPRGLWGIPFFVGLIGMFYHFKRDWRRAYPILMLFIMTGLAIIIYLNQEDPQPRERDYAYTGAFFAFAIWIGIGVTALIDLVQEALAGQRAKSAAVASSAAIKSRHDGAHGSHQQTPALGGVAWALSALVFLFVPANMFKFNYHEHNRQGNYVAYDYSYNILESCEPNAIIFTNGDNDTFPLWFLQYVYNIRRDVRVVNLSLLNTDWYIKQLRDDEPRVPINLTDVQIEGLQAIPWQTKTVVINVPKPVYDQHYENLVRLDSTIAREENPGVRIEVAPTLYGQGIRVQDLMILRILEDNKFRRPVYFAVTVSPENKLNLDAYMRMDGLAFKILPLKTNRRIVDPEVMWTNLNEKFLYRNLNNPKVYYDDNTKSLLGNYRSAFLTLAQYHIAHVERYKGIQVRDPETRAWEWQNHRDRALQVLDRMSEVIPESVIPSDNINLTLAVGQMYDQLERPEELDKRLVTVVNDETLPIEQRLQFINLFETYRGKPAQAESLAHAFITKNAGFREGYIWLGQFYQRRRQYQRGIEILDRWLTKKPDDQQAQTLVQQLRTMAQADSARPAGSGADTTGEK